MYRESVEALRQQTYDQVRELLTNYGKIDILWFDAGGDD
jgi:alpha-L-fucosidase